MISGDKASLNYFFRKSFLLIAVLFLGIVLSGCGTSPPSDNSIPAPDPIENEIRVHEYLNETAIDFKYSTDWTLINPKVGFLVTGPSEVVIP